MDPGLSLGAVLLETDESIHVHEQSNSCKIYVGATRPEKSRNPITELRGNRKDKYNTN